MIWVENVCVGVRVRNWLLFVTGSPELDAAVAVTE
jgi:hypothetical protein